MSLEELKKLISKDETKRIMDACKAEGSPQPFWSEEGGYTVVTFPMNKLNGRIVTPNEPQNALQKRLEAVAAMILANGSIAISVIAQNLNVSRDSIKRDLKKLGYAWEGASKNGHWVRKKRSPASPRPGQM